MFIDVLLGSIEEMNRLIGERMSNTCYCEKLAYSSFRFSKFKKFVFSSVFGSFKQRRYPLILKLPAKTQNQRSGSKSICDFFIILVLKGI